MCDRVCPAPCLPRTAAEAMHENEVDKRFRGRVKEVQSEGASRILHAVVGDSSGREGGGGRQVGVLAPKISNRLCRPNRGQGKVRRPGTIIPFFGPSLHTHTGIIYELYHIVSAFSLRSAQRELKFLFC